MSDPPSVRPAEIPSPPLRTDMPDRAPPTQLPSDCATEPVVYVLPPEALAEHRRCHRRGAFLIFLAMLAMLAVCLVLLWWACTPGRPRGRPPLAGFMWEWSIIILLPATIIWGGLVLFGYWWGERAAPRQYRIDAEGLHVRSAGWWTRYRWSRIRRWQLRVREGPVPRRMLRLVHGGWLIDANSIPVPAGAFGEQMIEAFRQRLPADARRPDRVFTRLKVTPTSAILLGILFVAQMLLIAWITPAWLELLGTIGGGASVILFWCGALAGFFIGLCHLWALLPEHRASRLRLKAALGIGSIASLQATTLGLFLGMGAAVQPGARTPQVPPSAPASAPASDQPASHLPQV